MKRYLIKVGENPPYLTWTPEGVTSFLTGVFLGSGSGLERAAATAEGVSGCLAKGGTFPEKLVSMLPGTRPVLAWWEDSTPAEIPGTWCDGLDGFGDHCGKSMHHKGNCDSGNH